jgi:alkylhydroperoxidase family enzyme
MALIKTVKHEQAEGETKEAFDTLQAMIGVIPAPMQLASASPGMLSMMWRSLKYFSQHPNLGFGLLSTIRYLVAQQYDYAFCTHFNKNFLLQQGMTEDDIQQIEEDPGQAPLDDRDRAMLTFVMKAIKTPDAVAKEDMDKLHGFGWTDADILDALAHGTNMIGASIMMKTFKMDQVC